MNLEAGVFRLDVGLQRACVLDRLGNFRKALLRVLQHDVDGRHAAVCRHDLVAQQGFSERDITTRLEERGVAVSSPLHEVLDDEVVLLGVGVLEVRDRVHADRVRDLPGRLGQFLDGRQGLAIKSRAGFRLHDEEEVVVLRVGVLQFFKRLQLGVGLREEHPVVGGELEPRCARAD